MKKLFLALATAMVVGLAHPAVAQESVVAQAKQELKAAGVQVENKACSDFEIAKIVAGRIPGAGLLTKDCCGDSTDPNRSHCEFNGVWYAHDIIAFPTGTIVDIAQDGGGTNGPTWQVDSSDPGLASRYRSATSLGLFGVVSGATPPPAPTPLPIPTPVPPVVVPPASNEIVPLLERIIALQQSQLDVILGIDATTKSTNEHVVSMDRTLAQTLGSVSKFVGKYIAPALVGYITAKKLQ